MGNFSLSSLRICQHIIYLTYSNKFFSDCVPGKDKSCLKTAAALPFSICTHIWGCPTALRHKTGVQRAALKEALSLISIQTCGTPLSLHWLSKEQHAWRPWDCEPQGSLRQDPSGFQLLPELGLSQSSQTQKLLWDSLSFRNTIIPKIIGLQSHRPTTGTSFNQTQHDQLVSEISTYKSTSTRN